MSEDALIEVSNPGFGASPRQQDTVPVETGRGNAVNVPVGADFVPTIERLADEANYGGYYRVFLNGIEIINPTDAPPRIESGMRICLTSYDKVG